jgi:hypothetical protein
VYTLRIHDPVPLQWAAIVGDAIHNARASLDLLACLFVQRAGGTVSQATAFPFSKDAASLPAAIAARLSGADPTVKTFVNRLRPYPTGNPQLYHLHSLDILDKHRLLLLVGAATSSVTVASRFEGAPGFPAMDLPPLSIRPAEPFPVTDGAELYRDNTPDTAGFTSLEPKFTFAIAFAEDPAAPGKPAVEAIDALITYVGRIITIAETRLL